MSYNTRRTGGAGRGQTTQVNYHQQPSRPGGTVTQQTRNPGYTTTQSANYSTSPSQPAYSTQQPTGYTTAPPLPAQAPAPPPPQPQQQAQTLAQPPLPSQPSTPASFKQEPVTPASTPKAADVTATENGDSNQPTKPFWRRKPYVKLSNKVKRLRSNAKLRRVLNPKNALIFLNELRPGSVKFVVREETGWGFVASVDVDGKTFSGHGITVNKAKVQACEQALRHILLDQLAKSQAAASATIAAAASGDKEEHKSNDEEMETDAAEGEEGDEPKRKRARTEEDEMPWGSLAAFALHKLFEEWQKDDAMSLPGPGQEKYDEDMGDDSYYRRPGPPPFDYQRRFTPNTGMFGRNRGFGQFGRGGRLPPPPAANFLGNPPKPQVAGPTTAPMKRIPDDANKRHPVMLLNQLRPNLAYNETREGEGPQAFFKISVEINGQEFIGRGKNKKDAKKMAAKAALAPMGIQYDEDN